jgi:hypothetical protein
LHPNKHAFTAKAVWADFPSFIQHGVEDFSLAEFVYRPAENQRVPTLEEHFIQAQEQTNPLPIWRPEIKLDCRHDDLTEEEYLQLLEIFFVAASWSRRQSKAKRSETRTTSMLAKRIYNSYHLGFPTLNLGAINHQPFIGSRLSAVTSDFHSCFAGAKAVESSRG